MSSDVDNKSKPGYLLDEARLNALIKKISNPELNTPYSVSRAVIFTTNRCNLRCNYCKSLNHQMPDWKTTELLNLLEKLASSGTKHIQWTGGEPSLIPELPELIRFSSSKKMHNSISTNATLETARYINLAESGMNRFYISLDAISTDAFDRLTASKGLYPRLIENIKALIKYRDKKNSIHLTINMMLNNDQLGYYMQNNGSHLLQILDFLINSGADDFKFLPALNGKIEAPHYRELFDHFISLCKNHVPGKYKMFHHRLVNIKNGGHGFHDNRYRHCYFALDDRTYSSRYAYPCVIQLREGGQPLYKRDESNAIKMEKINAYVAQNRSEDPICRRFCFDLYREINDKATLKFERSEIQK